MLRRNPTRPAHPRESTARHATLVRLFAILLVLGSIPGLGPAQLSAAPAPPVAHVLSRFDIPGWLSQPTASQLNVGFDVLLPVEVPAPFNGEPAVDAREGFYSFYWLIPGAPPTYLLITGEAGGTIPDFSYYDRNVQLEINADVQGVPAYHDLTPIYDRVYWQIGNVVYVVDSKNLESTDSLTLANNLTVLGPVGGDGQEDVNEPTDPAPAETPPPTETPAVPAPSGESAEATISCPTQAPIGKQQFITVSGKGTVTVEASDGAFPALTPNTDFAPDAAGGDVLAGTLPDGGSISLSWFAPSGELTAYIFVRDQQGNTLAECGILVVGVETEVPEEEPTATRTPIARAPGVLGDGTWVDERFDAVVSTVLAYRRAPVVNAPPTPTPKPKATVEPTPTFAPVVGADGLVAQDIGPEGGQLTCLSGSGSTLSIPPNALSETATVRIRPVADTKLPTFANMTLIPGTGFDVSIADPSGESIESLQIPARFSITLPESAAGARVMLYRVTNSGMIPLSDVTVEGTTVSGSLDGYSRVVAGMSGPSAQVSTTRDPMPFIIAALTVVVAMMVVVAVGSSLLRGRTRTVTPRRTAPSRARIR